jgi:hypothetical protein
MSRFIDKIKKTTRRIIDQDGVREGASMILATIANLVVALIKRK